MNKRIHIIAMTIIVIFICLIGLFSSAISNLILIMQNFIISKMNIYFIVINIVIIFLIFIGLSKYGKIKLGKPNDKVEYSNRAWYAMIFSAGMGIGIMFYSVADPLLIYQRNELFLTTNKTGSTLATVYFSWGIHAWAIYTLVGLAFAYFHYVKKLPMSLRSLFYPIFKNKVDGILGDIIDALGIFLTIFALCASLGIGTLQVSSGLFYLFDIKNSILIQVLIISVIMIIATFSVLSGVKKGVKVLSEINLKFVSILGIIIFIAGPSLLILKNIIFSTIIYFGGIIPASLNINQVDTSWAISGPVFYMAWWISWSLFVGIFIAKISKGRTIREFIFSILIVPTIFTIIWFSIIGTSAIDMDVNNSISTIVNQDISFSFYALIQSLFNSQVLVSVMELFSVLIIVFFFITSADSGAIVISELANKGQCVSKKDKVFWTTIQGVITILLVLIGGSKVLALIQSILITISYPFVFVLLYLMIALFYSLKNDEKTSVK